MPTSISSLLDRTSPGHGAPRGARIPVEHPELVLAEQMLAGQIGLSTPAVSIDLHWDLFYSQRDRAVRSPSEELIARSRMVDAAGLRLPTFDAPDTLITLAGHAARSGGHRLLWLKDIERTIAVDRPDFDEVVRRSRYGCAPPVGIILRAPSPSSAPRCPTRSCRRWFLGRSTTCRRRSATRCSSTNATLRHGGCRGSGIDSIHPERRPAGSHISPCNESGHLQ